MSNHPFKPYVGIAICVPCAREYIRESDRLIRRHSCEVWVRNSAGHWVFKGKRPCPGSNTIPEEPAWFAGMAPTGEGHDG